MNEYHERFLNSFTSELILPLFCRYRGSSKEITESFGILEAGRAYFPSLCDYKVVVVGDGCSPRTGAMFAYFSKAEVVSIDPQFNIEHWEEFVQKQTAMGFPPKRLCLIKDKVENVTIDCDRKKLLVVWPHSHASMNEGKFENFSLRGDIALPCCKPIPREWREIPHLTYDDKWILSPKRTIHIWNAQKELA